MSDNKTLNPSNYIQLISPIKQEALFYKKEADKIENVNDDLTHRQAGELRKKITSFLTGGEKKRKAITKPILDFKKQIDELAKDSLNPAFKSKEKLTKLIIAYEEKLEKQRQAELARIAKIKQPFLVANLKDTLELNIEMLEKVKTYFQGLDKKDQENPEILESCNSLVERIKTKIHLQREEIEAKKEAERLAKIKAEQNAEAIKQAEEQARLDKIKREQQAEAQRIKDLEIKAEIERKKKLAEAQAETTRVKTGLKERWTFEIVNDQEVPREFCEPSTKLINQAIRDGKREIKGIKIYKVKK